MESSIELLRTNQYYIFIRGEYGLWWNRITGEFQARTGWDLAKENDPDCLGIVYGIIGKIELQSVVQSQLMLIKECASVGELPGGKTVYKIKSVIFLQSGITGETTDLGLHLCKKHQSLREAKKSIGVGGIFDIHQKAALAKTWGTIKLATNTIKNTTQQAAALAASQVKSTGKRRDSRDKEKFERRILEELQRIFTDTDSFYFSILGDLTNSLQRQCNLPNGQFVKKFNLWKYVDDRFFWNKHMLQDIISLDTELADPWIVPIIQGFVQIENCKVEVGSDHLAIGVQERKYETFTICLISRRSRFRAGTRYKRRGVDENGKCANYVETEQIISYHHHQVSFIQVRGSVPVFWSQPGYKYRPPPRLDKGEAETQVAFEKHFAEELSIYGPLCIVNLVEQSGKENIIWDAYTNHIIAFNCPDLIYTTFDFHEYCRGMHFENVSVLIASIVDIIKDMSYCWKDSEGIICSQKGVFRVNCIDCLDRTNVVQTAIAKAVMEIQFTKLGLIPPEGIMPANIRNTFQLLWANNGDIISKQYAGTNALKGDYTRTGERKFTGMMKDGMNSANRYLSGHFVDAYRQAGIDIMQGVDVDDADWGSELQTAAGIAQALIPFSPVSYVAEIPFEPEFQLLTSLFQISRYYLSRFKDVYRQATIDMMLGNTVSDELFIHEKTADEEDASLTAEHVKLLIEDCKKMLISDSEVILGAWGLIDADPISGDPTETEMDSILILTRDSYYVAEYDDQVDRVTKYQRVPLGDLQLVECGPLEQTSVPIFKQAPRPGPHCIRLHYVVSYQPGYFHMFRSTNLRFFNNVAVEIRTEEEMIESLKAICEAIMVALEVGGLTAVPYLQQKLERKKSKVVGRSHGSSNYLDVSQLPHMTRNVSETQLLALKSVGTKALTNMSQQFNKLNKLGHSFNTKKVKSLRENESLQRGPIFTVGTLSATTHDSISTNIKQFSDDDEEDVLMFGLDTIPPNIIDSSTMEVSSKIKSTDSFLPGVGIVMMPKTFKTNEPSIHRGNKEVDHLMFHPEAAPCIDNVSLSRVVQNVSIHKHILTHSRTDLSLDVSNLSVDVILPKHVSLTPSPNRPGSATPEITVVNTVLPAEEYVTTNDKHSYLVFSSPSEGDGNVLTEKRGSVGSKLTPPNTLPLTRKLSHSSDEVDRKQGSKLSEGISAHLKHGKAVGVDVSQGDIRGLVGGHRCSSERDLSFNITSSQSENALRSIRTGFTNAITSPVATTKDLVLSPFSKLAKGMQTLGANFDPRKLKGPTNVNALGRCGVLEHHMEEVEKLKERWKNCRTRLIAL